MSKFNQLLNKQKQEKKAQVEQPSQDVSSQTVEDTLSPVQRRAQAGNQYGVSLKRISVDLIDPSPYQPRLVVALDLLELQELADNIRQHGQINPIVVRPKNGRYELIGGERRLQAVRDVLKLKDIDCLIKDVSDEKAALTALVDNINRADLSDYEIAHALSNNCERFGYPIDNVEFMTEKFNISRNKYYRLISLFDLPSFIRQDLSQNPSALSGSGASLLKTALNKVTEQIGQQNALEILQAAWQQYFTQEFPQTNKRNTQFIKLFEQQAQQLFEQKHPQLNIVDDMPEVKIQDELTQKTKKVNPQQESLLTAGGKKFGSLKCSESLKGKTVVSIRMSVADLDETKLDKIKQFLQELA
jgi:ParB family transcriptional regulator, chromosome partitioning protein